MEKGTVADRRENQMVTSKVGLEKEEGRSVSIREARERVRD